MNKFLKLLYVNILDMFNINKIFIARKDGVKSDLEKRSVIVSIGILIIGYILYSLLIKLKFDNLFTLFGIGFLLSTLACLVFSISLINPIVFESNDNEILFSYPVTKNQIVFSKLFFVYLKNIFVVLVVMFATLFAYMKVGKVDETLILLYLVSSLFIPFVPIIVVTFFTYINDYLKVKLRKINYLLIKYGFIVVIMLVSLLFIKSQNMINTNNSIESLINILNILYPLGYIFVRLISNESILFFFLYIILNILFISLYNNLMSNNILKICSMLQGVNKKHNFVYKKSNNLHVFGGLLRKEFNNLLSNKLYLFSSFSVNVVFLVIFIIGINIIDVNVFNKFQDFDIYFNNYAPALLGTINSLNVMTISAISLEKSNMMMLRTMPVSMGTILISKWLCNIMIGSIFTIIEAIILIVKFNLNKVSMIFFIILPIFVLMFVSLTGLVLDYIFTSKKETSDSVIIKQRIIVFIPTAISLLVGLLPLFLKIGVKYNYFSSAYVALMIVLMLLEVIYLVINEKRLVKNLFS